MPLQAHSHITLKSHCHQERFMKTVKKQVLLLSSGRAMRRIWRTTDQSASPQFLGANNQRNYFQIPEKKDSDGK